MTGRGDFYEEDESVEQVAAAFDAGEKARTSRVRGVEVSRPSPQWQAGDPDRPVRLKVAGVAYQDLTPADAVAVALQLIQQARVDSDGRDPVFEEGVRQGRAQVAETLRYAAAGRQHYRDVANDPKIQRDHPNKAAELELEIATIEAAAQVAAGDLGPLYGWLPSWRWTPEMEAKLGLPAADRAEPTPEPANSVEYGVRAGIYIAQLKSDFGDALACAARYQHVHGYEALVQVRDVTAWRDLVVPPGTPIPRIVTCRHNPEPHVLDEDKVDDGGCVDVVDVELPPAVAAAVAGRPRG